MSQTISSKKNRTYWKQASFREEAQYNCRKWLLCKKEKRICYFQHRHYKNFGESSSSDWTLDDITERDLQVSTEVIDTLTKWKQEYNTPPGNSLHSEATPEELAMIEEFKKRGLI